MTNTSPKQPALPQIILDAHLDIAMNNLAFGRDLRDATWVTRRREGKFPGAPYDKVGVATVGLPDMLLGRVGIIFATLWENPQASSLVPALSYETPEQAHALAQRQLDYYKRLADEDDRIRLIRDQAELDSVLASWQPDQAYEARKLGVVILMEGADPILEPKQTEAWYEQGLRIIGPAWQATRYSAGTGENGPLSNLGHELLAVMSDYNMILDLSHLAERAYYQALDEYPGPVLASHSNPRHFVNSDRHLSDDMIRRLAERDGVMGIVFFNIFLLEGWSASRDRKTDVSVNIPLEMIDHVCQVTGSAAHVGIGTDWDGGFGWESIPHPLDSHLDLWHMREWLAERGYPENDVQNILCGNFLRVLRRGLPR